MRDSDTYPDFCTKRADNTAAVGKLLFEGCQNFVFAPSRSIP